MCCNCDRKGLEEGVKQAGFCNSVALRQMHSNGELEYYQNSKPYDMSLLEYVKQMLLSVYEVPNNLINVSKKNNVTVVFKKNTCSKIEESKDSSKIINIVFKDSDDSSPYLIAVKITFEKLIKKDMLSKERRKFNA